MRPGARNLIRNRLGARREIRLPDGFDRGHERREIIARIGSAQGTDHEIHVCADVEVLSHDGDLARTGADTLLGHPVGRAWSDLERLLTSAGEHDDCGGDLVQTVLHNGLLVEGGTLSSDVPAFPQAVKEASSHSRAVAPVRGSRRRAPRNTVRPKWMR